MCYCCIRYKEEALPLLDQAKSLLSQLRPLTLKLEVIENLFLALFGSGSDIRGSQDVINAYLVISNSFISNVTHVYIFRLKILCILDTLKLNHFFAFLSNF